MLCSFAYCLCAMVLCSLGQVGSSVHSPTYTLGLSQDATPHNVTQPGKFYIQSDNYGQGNYEGKANHTSKNILIAKDFCCYLKSKPGDHLQAKSDYINIWANGRNYERYNDYNNTGAVNVHARMCWGRFAIEFVKGGSNDGQSKGSTGFKLTFSCYSSPNAPAGLHTHPIGPGPPDPLPTNQPSPSSRKPTPVPVVPVAPSRSPVDSANNQNRGDERPSATEDPALSSLAIAALVLCPLCLIIGIALIVALGGCRPRKRFNEIGVFADESTPPVDKHAPGPYGPTPESKTYPMPGTKLKTPPAHPEGGDDHKGSTSGERRRATKHVSLWSYLRGSHDLISADQYTAPSGTKSTGGKSRNQAPSSVTYPLSINASAKSLKSKPAPGPGDKTKTDTDTAATDNTTKSSGGGSMFNSIRSMFGYGKARTGDATSATATGTTSTGHTSHDVKSLSAKG